jgi:hypothetical protein
MTPLTPLVTTETPEQSGVSSFKEQLGGQTIPLNNGAQSSISDAADIPGAAAGQPEGLTSTMSTDEFIFMALMCGDFFKSLDGKIKPANDAEKISAETAKRCYQYSWIRALKDGKNAAVTPAGRSAYKAEKKRRGF